VLEALVVGACVVSFAGASWAQDEVVPSIEELSSKEQEQLGDLLSGAKLMFESGRFAGAIDLLEQAYTIYPHPKVSRRLGEAHERSGNFVRAIGYYRDYVVRLPEAPDRKEVNGFITNLEARLATITVDARPPGSRVRIGILPPKT